MYKQAILFTLLLLVFSATSSRAQTPSPGQEPEAQSSRFQKEIKEKKEQLREEKVQAPQVEIQEEKPKPSGIIVKFTLESVTVTGSTIFSQYDFAPIYQPYLRKIITFVELEKIAEQIKAKYKERGYLTTTVYIPEQKILDGKIEIRVLEGKMGDLVVEGNKWFSASLITKYFHTKKNELLNIKTLQKDLLRLNQNPDLELKSVIGAGREQGATDVTLQATEKMPYHLGAGFDNYGSRLTGKYRTSILFWSPNITNHFDMLFINTIFSTHTFGESLSYTLPITTYGTKFSIDAAFFKMKLGKEFALYDITGTTQVYTPHLIHELNLSEDFQASVDLGLEIKNIKKKMRGDVTTKENFRLPYVSLDVSKNDAYGQTSFSPRFTFGTKNFLGASERNHASASRAGTGGFFFKYDCTLKRLQRMWQGSYIQANVKFQTASHTLASSEQFQIGGSSSVRGYPEGDYLADTGGLLNIDWVFPMYLIPADWKLAHADTALRHQIQPVVFFDVGGGTLKTVNAGERSSKFLAGVGGGLRINFKRYVSLRAEWATHIGDEPTSGSGPSTFHLTFQSEI